MENLLTIDEKNRILSHGFNCPVCGMQMIDLAHDGYDCGDPNFHDYYCTTCNIDFTIIVEDNDESSNS